MEQVDAFPCLGFLIAEDGECTAEIRTRLNGGSMQLQGRRSGHRCRKYGKVTRTAYRFQRSYDPKAVEICFR